MNWFWTLSWNPWCLSFSESFTVKSLYFNKFFIIIVNSTIITHLLCFRWYPYKSPLLFLRFSFLFLTSLFFFFSDLLSTFFLSSCFIWCWNITLRISCIYSFYFLVFLLKVFEFFFLNFRYQPNKFYEFIQNFIERLIFLWKFWCEFLLNFFVYQKMKTFVIISLLFLKIISIYN